MQKRLRGGVSHAQTPPSHEEKGLVTIEHFLGCVESDNDLVLCSQSAVTQPLT